MTQTSEDRALARLERHIFGVLRVCQYVGISFVVAMMFLTVVSSVGRYVFKLPVPGLIELSSFMLVTMIFLSVAYVQIIKGHVSIGLIVDRLSERTQAIIDSCTYTLGLAVAILAAKQTFVESITMMRSSETSLVLGIPPFPFLFIVGFSWILFSLAILVNLVHFISRALKK